MPPKAMKTCLANSWPIFEVLVRANLKRHARHGPIVRETRNMQHPRAGDDSRKSLADAFAVNDRSRTDGFQFVKLGCGEVPGVFCCSSQRVWAKRKRWS